MNEKTIWVFQYLQQQIDELQATIKRMNEAEAPSLIEIDMIANQLADCYSKLMGLRHHKVEAAAQQLDKQTNVHAAAPQPTAPANSSPAAATPKPTAAPSPEPIAKEERAAAPPAAVVAPATQDNAAKPSAQAKEKASSTTAPDLFSPAQDTEDMNAKLGKMLAKPSVVDKLSSRVNSLQSSIGINDKFLFVNSLFDGQVDTYKRSIKALSSCQHMAEAQALLNSMATEQQWASDEPALARLRNLLKQSYGM